MSIPRNAGPSAVEQSADMHRDRLSRLRLWKARCGKKAAHPGGSSVFNEEGSQLVEMALTCGILMALLIGLLQITLAVYSYHYVSEAAREATRWAIVRGSACTGFTHCNAANSDIQTYAQSLGYPGITAAHLTTHTWWYTATYDTTVTPNTIAGAGGLTQCGTEDTPSAGCNQPGNQVKVQVSYTYSMGAFNLLFGKIIPSRTINITSTSAMVISQ